MSKISPAAYNGRSRFCFGKKYITGSSKDNITLISAYGGIIIALILYGFTFGRYLMTTSTGILFPALTYIISAVGWYYLLKTTFTDPGIIPRGNYESYEDAMQALIWSTDQENGNMNFPLVKLDDSGTAASTRILQNPEKDKAPAKNLAIYQYRYCHTCKILRPPKASHCGDCDNCVKNFDHHCFFVGNCIGRRNHKYFFLFLFIASVVCFMNTITGIYGFLSIAAQHPIVETEIRNSTDYWIASAALLLLGTFCCISKTWESLKYTLVGAGVVVLILGFYSVSEKIDVPYYESPGTFAGYVFAQLPFAWWIVSSFLGNLWGISRGLTFKEKHSINKGVLDAGERRNIYRLTWKEKVDNFKEFFAREEIESQIEGVY